MERQRLGNGDHGAVERGEVQTATVAVALFGIIAAACVLAILLVRSMELAVFYAVLAIVVPLGWVRFRRRPDPTPPSRVAAAPPEPNAPPEPDTAVGPDAPPEPDTAAEPSSRPSPPVRSRERCVVGYVCVARDADGSELAMHTNAMRVWAADNRARMTAVVHDVARGQGERGARPALSWALERIAAGEADALVTARLEHLSPAIADLVPLLAWFTAGERSLVAIDFQLDTATEEGRLAASALAGVGEWERQRLSVRTRRGLEAARARGSGQGRAAVADIPELRERIVRMREQGMTLQAIADILNEEGVATLRGGAKWRPSSVQWATGYRRPASTRARIELPGSVPDRDGPTPSR